MVAAVGAIAAIGVAFWNTRGESIELRQLKAMNEAEESLAEGSEEAAAFARARDALAVRIALRVMTAPGRRRLGWYITFAIVVLGVLVTGGVLLTSNSELSDLAPSWVSLGLTLAAGVVTLVAWTETSRSERMKRAVADSLWQLKVFRASDEKG